MKAFFYLFPVLILFSSCESIEEKKQNAIRDFISERGFSGEDIINLTEDSAAVALLDFNAIGKAMDLLDKIQKSKTIIEELRNATNDESRRIWLKTMTTEQKNAYDKLLELEEESNQSWIALNKEVIGKKTDNKQSKISLLELKRDSTDDGVKEFILYFDNPHDPTVISVQNPDDIRSQNPVISVHLVG